MTSPDDIQLVKWIAGFAIGNIFSVLTAYVAIREPGKYRIRARSWMNVAATSVGQSYDFRLKTGSIAAAGTTIDMSYWISSIVGQYSPVHLLDYTVRALAGDTYTIQISSDIGAARTIYTSRELANICIEKIGNY